MKHIIDYFPYAINAEQEAACEALEAFLANADARQHIFILKGHAGTGKTTLLKALKDYLSGIRTINFIATTGRAGKILARKIDSETETVHSYIYMLKTQTYGVEKGGERLLRFALKNNMDSLETITAIDESSMLSNKPVKNRILDFGSGRLLTDLLQFIGPRKVIFVGDPAQLPPVNTDFAAALNEDYMLEKFGVKSMVASLSQVMRYKDKDFIGESTRRLRDIIGAQEFPYLSVKITGYKNVQMFNHPHDMAKHFADRLRTQGIENQVMLTFSNAMAYDLNKQIRRHFYKGIYNIKEGDLMMVYQNNYKYNLYNGDQVIVDDIEVPFEKHFGFRYGDITLKIQGERSDHRIKAKFLVDFLDRKEPYLNPEEENEIMRDFAIRAQQKGIERNTDAYYEFMKNDPYFNALRLKFGYASTVHKAQGGEWKNVYLVIEKSMFYQSKSLQHRWMYTAISRAIEQVYILSNRCLY